MNIFSSLLFFTIFPFIGWAIDQSSFSMNDYSDIDEVDRMMLVDYIPLKLEGEVKASSLVRLTLSKAIEMALEKNPNYLSVQESLFASEASQTVSFSNLLPYIDYDYSTTHYRHGSQNASYSSEFSLTQTLFSGFSLYSQWQISKLSTEQSRNTLERARQKLVFDVRAAWYALMSSLKFKEESEDSLQRVKEVSRMSQRFFEEGNGAYNRSFRF